ncbi:MAG: hypothetical protein JNL78_03945 [Rhodocyclaceae bacterium]|jgi:hypothetical protein|nr:hypothetical protein [Rhodocyclaceae bacterium]
MLAGLLLAVLGPLLLLLPCGLLYFLFRRAGLGGRLGLSPVNARLLHLAAAAGLVFGVVLASYLPGRLEYERLCQALAEPRIHDRARVEGFFLDDLTASSFGQRYLGEEGFAWFETHDIYKRGQFVRYGRAGDKVVNEPVSVLQARHTVKSGVEVRPDGIHVARTAITEREGGRLLAEAHSVTYHGGPLGMVLGVHGMSHCPNPITPEGSRQFDLYYHLVREVLGSGNRP